MSLTSRSRTLLLPLLGVVAGLSACGGGDKGMDPEPEPPLVNTPSAVIQDLRNAWDTRDFSPLSGVFSDQFLFLTSPNDVDFWLTPPQWGRSEELDCTQLIFDGLKGTRPDGSAQSAIDVRFPFGLFILAIDDDWVELTEGPYAGMLYRLYSYTMVSQYENGDFDFIDGNAEFYVVEEPFVQEDGTDARRYVIRVFKDRGQPLPALRHGVFSWGYLKGLYQQASP
ncbi:MAG: hypothetical protein HKN12_02055 [Gemmatimonadetes bacterium]|nr:hypothetical protein [Gemmatimonadota bacterium]